MKPNTTAALVIAGVALMAQPVHASIPESSILASASQPASATSARGSVETTPADDIGRSFTYAGCSWTFDGPPPHVRVGLVPETGTGAPALVTPSELEEWRELGPDGAVFPVRLGAREIYLGTDLRRPTRDAAQRRRERPE